MSRNSSSLTAKIQGISIRVKGTVQGVGFRPFVWTVANQLELRGEVSNDSQGVLINAWGSEDRLEQFVARIENQPPPLAKVEEIVASKLKDVPCPVGPFKIAKSTSSVANTGVSVDAATCKDCLSEIFDPLNRRYRYPFTNCTNCGPRLTIINSIPYDRKNTSMAVFAMCQDCQAEYDNPSDRRFHAQPNACSKCGPQVALSRLDGKDFCLDSYSSIDELDAIVELILQGEIVAVKGLGGYQLLCDATNDAAVEKLRKRKNRDKKPFAMLARDLNVVSNYCELLESERTALEHIARPIVLLDKEETNTLASGIAPGFMSLGFMLPSTPLYYLIMQHLDRPVVCTSGNLSDEPQCIEDALARTRLRAIADWILTNDRDIVNRVDDSVVRVIADCPRALRRSRGYAPESMTMPVGLSHTPEILSMGAELKSTLCLIKNGRAVLTQHIGDLEEYRTYKDYKHNLNLYQKLYEHKPEHVAIDMHPEYLSSKLGVELGKDNGLKIHHIQHHHAHIAACMFENKFPLDGGKVLGIALDGLGYSPEGLWGGEFLLSDYRDFKRLATFKPVALIGGSKAMREPWRNTYAHIISEMGWRLYKSNFEKLELTKFLESKPLATIDGMMKTKTNVQEASSCGRLFDAVAAAIDICREKNSFEGQAAMELEALVDEDTLTKDDTKAYPFTTSRLQETDIPYIEPIAMWETLFNDLLSKTPKEIIAARFHKGLALAIVSMVKHLTVKDKTRWLNNIALSGGVFQNKILTSLVLEQLEKDGYTVFTHSKIPANDGGIALGQAVITAARLTAKKGER